jgi:hypothetical protein
MLKRCGRVDDHRSVIDTSEIAYILLGDGPRPVPPVTELGSQLAAINEAVGPVLNVRMKLTAYYQYPDTRAFENCSVAAVFPPCLFPRTPV